MILPVRFRIADEDAIRIETAPGTTLHRATDRTVVAFEAEGRPGAAEPSWSVVVHGVATHPHPGDRILTGDRVAIVVHVDDVSGREVLGANTPVAPAFTAARARW